MAVTKILTIQNEKGLHARASAKFVDVVEKFNAEVEVFKDGFSASGNSIMGLLMLGASKGTTIEIRVSGDDAESLANALEELVGNRFGEKY